jgi:hypothetical protein
MKKNSHNKELKGSKPGLKTGPKPKGALPKAKGTKGTNGINLNLDQKGAQVLRTQKRYEILFNNYLIYLLNKLHELENLGHSEIKENLDHCFLKYSKLAENNRIQEYLQHVFDRFQPHIKLVAEQDDFLFANDYNKGDLRLISGLDLYSIWQILEQLDHEKALNLKKIIWKSLTNLYVSACLALGKTDDSWAISIMKNLRLAKQLEKEIEDEGAAEAAEDAEAKGEGDLAGFGIPNISDFEKIFNSDNALSQIMSDMKNEINPEELMRSINPENKPPLEIIMGLFSGQNQDMLQAVTTSFASKFEDKMKQRGLTENDLKNAADDMKKDLSKIPAFGMLLSQLNTSDLSLPGLTGSTSEQSSNVQNEPNFQNLQNEPNLEKYEANLHNLQKLPWCDRHSPEWPAPDSLYANDQNLQNEPNLQNLQNLQNDQNLQNVIPMINSLFTTLQSSQQHLFQNVQDPQAQDTHTQQVTQVTQGTQGTLDTQDMQGTQVTQDTHNIYDSNVQDSLTKLFETIKKMQE